MAEIAEKIPYRGIRRTIGKRMEQSRQIPHHYQGIYVDVTDLLTLREQANTEHPQDKLSVNDFIVRATSLALQKTPILNSTLVENEIQVYKSVNLGIMAAVDKGLIAPVVKESQTKDIYALSREIKELLGKARSGTLTPDEYSDGTFSITNIGPLKTEDSVPLMFPSQCGILAVCATKKMAVVREINGEDVISVRSMCKLVIGSDHRVTDGVPLARFLNDMKDLLEHPEQLMS